MDEGLSYGYRRKRDIVIAEAPSLEDSVLVHMVPGTVSVQQLQDEGTLVTASGGRVRTTVYRTRPEKVSNIEDCLCILWAGCDGELCQSDSQGHPGHQWHGPHGRQGDPISLHEPPPLVYR